MTATAEAGTPHRWRVTVTGPGLGEDTRAVEDVDAALRHLVAACRAARRPLPVVPALTVGDGVVEVHVAAPLGRAPAPWRTRGHVWSVAVDDLGDADGVESGRTTFEAYPALAEVGVLEGEGFLLADLGAAPGLVEIDGPGRDVEAVLGRLAGSLLERPWSAGVRLSVVGGEDRRDPRVRCLAALADAIGPAPVTPGGVTGRWGPAPRQTHEIVLMSRPPDAGERRLIRSVSRWRDAPTVVAPGAGRGVWRWRVHEGTLTW